MRTKFFSLVFFLIASSSFSQNAVQLLSATKQLYEANYLMDFEGIVALSYPKMVETIGKDVLLEKLDQFYENEEYRLRYQVQTVPFITPKIKKIGNQSFCVISCRNPLRYFFEKKLTTDEAADKKIWLQEINKTKDVTFEPNRNSFNVKKQSKFVAVMDETTHGEWKFFNLDDANQLASFELLIDESVRKELGL
ncbi:hypothetical protein [Flavobacterium sp.]|uniref:hypothetical protein n=1 Tax=Flavobacterium sp. TaxID=239 RepID=UPI002FDA7BB0